jgi:hypothetical protein
MQKTILNDVFELLLQIGVVSSESEFSRVWLCRSECYVRTLRFKPCVYVSYMCKQATALRSSMTVTEVHTELGNRLIELSARCYKQINADAMGCWKDEVRV